MYMYCPNCGNELNGNKFCIKCGYNTEPSNTNEVVNTTPPKKTNKKGLALVLIIVFLIIAFVVGIFALVFIFVFKLINNVGTMEYVEVNDLKIPSVYKVLGERKEICGFKGSLGDNPTTTIDYCNELSDTEEQLYVEYLIEYDAFELVPGSFKYSLTKEVDGKVYVVTIDDNDNITYSFNDNVGESKKENVEM